MRDGNYDRELACPFFGGYVLRIDGDDKFFPQCCSDISNINYWEGHADKGGGYHCGHPTPVVKYKHDSIIFDFTTKPGDERFVPVPPEMHLSFDVNFLRQAVAIVKIELNEFASRLLSINKSENLGITDIDKLLVWGDD